MTPSDKAVELAALLQDIATHLNTVYAGPKERELVRRILALSAAAPAMQAPPDVVRDNIQNGWAALHMIREAIETLGPSGILPSEEAVLGLHGPEPVHEATVLVEALQKLFSSPAMQEANAMPGREEIAQLAIQHARRWGNHDPGILPMLIAFGESFVPAPQPDMETKK